MFVDIINIFIDVITLILAICGFKVAKKEYLKGKAQLKIDNSFNYIDLFYSSICKKDLDMWEYLYKYSSEMSGASPGHFLVFCNESKKYKQRKFESLFTEGAYDNYALSRIATMLDLVSYNILNDFLDSRLIYYELGIYIHTTINWIKSIDNGQFLKKEYINLYRISKEVDFIYGNYKKHIFPE